MSLALKEAWKYQGLTYPNPAVGCVVVGENSEILSVEAHHRAGKPHAEVNALQTAYYKLTSDSYILSLQNSHDIHNYLLKNHNAIFENISLFTTLEPCSHTGKTPSCATLISELGIKKVFVGSSDTNREAKNGNLILQNNSCEVQTKVLKEECDILLFPFTKFLDSRFVFFKWAQRLNATTDDGIISSKESRKNVHAMRDVCDLLVIGGNTVRTDRPTLDARDVDGKAPDILIYSRNDNFDRTIPLFNVKGRKVYIESDFKKLDNYKNIMIEGTSNMYELTRDIVDYYLCYVAPSFGGKEGFSVENSKFEILNMYQVDKDIIMWMKRI
ncbi:bifunctional diaminohydroxyphosphoribosylaminopyrimidine deaminase/5-amino-6-(5-phosphoribosylamino)uracil reductase RibD [Sulfurimonas sp.]|jgi:diaminohydroxyphosphoribosylaminopyrimidine deaminase / 5-amino-6-(5-phosphoribosylamino)uracil reductase|uniref:bifunctional diaminohydroxyphosphoribosylaminopyrimidine deaminase/5-amino-6-(5-phosphoribosylamino)uracil reductase RibD n=1 Tax=Sulfurimonas sp. TaxID=2022749 RepID=UPI0025FE6696|nr:bifunctional diaminohydroxyphosphoribosylaminopyrimidine deaminase/5-amino-6-(5-phosphoribosylamino)uracil reductase RibD [Sulfurimonas sp.]